MADIHKTSDEQQFILDIGTRSVVGIAGHTEGDVFMVDAWTAEAHPRRAMIDGQIEDIPQVARVAQLVRERLEEQLGRAFSRVSVAAAGRALKTRRASASQKFGNVALTPQMAYSLENAAVNTARLQLDEDQSATPYYCVGHSVVRYMLDGYPFTNAVGHRANAAEVEVIATFLPAEVVESLHCCMELLGLEIDTITLEPIAAMRAVIPQDLRLLNLALVDIGAGTSDIAISNDSTVAGYTMATVAGDEITEAIIRQFLVDFNTAERLKMALEPGGPFDFVDILGFAHTPAAAEVETTIAAAVDTLAQTLAEKIVECNDGKPPAAVFLVGGGSKIPGLCALLAAKLELPPNRVALAGTNFSGRIINKDSGLDDPEYATPVGIALVAADNALVDTTTVAINGKKVRLFLPDTSSVMDALLIGGYRYADLMGRNGRSLTFTLNGVRTVVRGTPYTTATVGINGKPASLSAPVKSGDAITIETAKNGEDACATLAAYAPAEACLHVQLNGLPQPAGLVARINGAVAPLETALQEQDTVDFVVIKTLGALCDAASIDTAAAQITVNGVPAERAHPLQEGERVVVAAENAPSTPPAAETAPGPSPQAPLPENAPAFGRSLPVTLNGKSVVLPPKSGTESYCLFDMLPLVDIDPDEPKGTLSLCVNGEDSSYTAALSAGDTIAISWEEP